MTWRRDNLEFNSVYMGDACVRGEDRYAFACAVLDRSHYHPDFVDGWCLYRTLVRGLNPYYVDVEVSERGLFICSCDGRAHVLPQYDDDVYSRCCAHVKAVVQVLERVDA